MMIGLATLMKKFIYDLIGSAVNAHMDRSGSCRTFFADHGAGRVEHGTERLFCRCGSRESFVGFQLECIWQIKVLHGGGYLSFDNRPGQYCSTGSVPVVCPPFR